MGEAVLGSGARHAWPPPLAAWSAVGVFCVAAILSYTDRQVLSLLVDPIRADLRISDTQVGVLQGVAFAIVYSVAGLPIGRLADLVRRRSVILGGIALWSLGTLVCGYAGSFGALFAGRLIVGIGEAALAPAATSMISDMFPAERRGLAIGTFVMGMALGGGVAITIGGWMLGLAQAGGLAAVPLIGKLAPWRAVLVLLGLLGGPLLVLLAFVREPVRHATLADTGGAGPGLRAVIAQLGEVRAALGPTVAACALMSVGDFALLSWSPALLGRRFGMAPDAIGLMLGPLIMATGAIACAGGGWISDRLARGRGSAGRLQLALVASLLALPFAFVAFLGSGTAVLWSVALWLLFSTTAGVAGIISVQEIAPSRARGLAASFIAFGNIMLGLGGGATLTGWLTDHLFADPQAVGRSLTLVIVPAALLAILSFHLAARAARRLHP